MSTKSINDYALGLLQEKSGQTVSLETHLDGLNIDSLDFMEVVMRVEDEYNIKIPDEDFENFYPNFSRGTVIVKEAIEYFEQRIAQHT